MDGQDRCHTVVDRSRVRVLQCVSLSRNTGCQTNSVRPMLLHRCSESMTCTYARAMRVEATDSVTRLDEASLSLRQPQTERSVTELVGWGKERHAPCGAWCNIKDDTLHHAMNVQSWSTKTNHAARSNMCDASSDGICQQFPSLQL